MKVCHNVGELLPAAFNDGGNPMFYSLHAVHDGDCSCHQIVKFLQCSLLFVTQLLSFKRVNLSMRVSALQPSVRETRCPILRVLPAPPTSPNRLFLHLIFP